MMEKLAGAGEVAEVGSIRSQWNSYLLLTLPVCSAQFLASSHYTLLPPWPLSPLQVHQPSLQLIQQFPPWLRVRVN